MVAWVVIALMPALAACDSASQVSIVSADNSTRGTVKVEIADKPDTRELGLMYREHLDDNAGMLFIFPAPTTAQFWMKNTMIPLDMLFADSSGKVLGIVADAQPYSQALLGGFAGTLYVLEVNGGYAAQHHVVAGDRLQFRGFNPHTNH
ncbi:MAG TPA: DUF192 domain-containing protein [Candidatus Binataceae bacterium]|nr:DUF192 domain-containing protein [Candidatus Binataceae bacterium]